MKSKVRIFAPEDRIPRTRQIWAVFLTVFTSILVAGLVALTFLVAVDRSSSKSAAQSGSFDAEIISRSLDSHYGIIRAIPDPADSAPRLVLDQSYWRLVRQGKARIIPGTEKYLAPGDPGADPYNLANFSDIDLDAVTLQSSELGWYNIYGSPGASGTIICRLHSKTQEVTVSVPVLSPELKALADSRGDHYILIYNENIDDESTTRLLFYQEHATLLIIRPDSELPLILPSGEIGGVEYCLYPDSNIFSITHHPAGSEYTACTPVAKLFTNRTAPDFWDVGQLQATPTTFSASPEQVAVLKAQLDQVEFEYLSSEILENLITSPE